MKKEKVLIVGAGLSGLYTALLLQERYEIIVIEARDRLGGRVYSVEGHDMGPSWVWEHQEHILALIKSLDLEIFEQYTQGLALYDAPDGIQKFTPPPATSYRVRGGISAILNALEKKLTDSIHFTEVLKELKEVGNHVSVHTSQNDYLVDKVILTMPPRLCAESVFYSPDLPLEPRTDLMNVPTWMGYVTKCVIEYPRAFWRDEGLSGLTFSPLGPLGEIHDACLEGRAALFGFAQTKANNDSLEEDIIKQLTRLYGDIASKPTQVYIKLWHKDIYTASHQDSHALNEHPKYGFESQHFSGKILFSGTESAFDEGGYLEGSLVSSLESTKYLI